MKLYVEDLPQGVTERDITGLFSKFGSIESVHLVKDDGGEPQGQAYVSMPSDTEAEQAIAGLDGTMYKGVRIHVSESEDPEFPTEEYW